MSPWQHANRSLWLFVTIPMQNQTASWARRPTRSSLRRNSRRKYDLSEHRSKLHLRCILCRTIQDTQLDTPLCISRRRSSYPAQTDALPGRTYGIRCRRRRHTFRSRCTLTECRKSAVYASRTPDCDTRCNAGDTL